MTLIINTTDGKIHRVEGLTKEQAIKLALALTPEESHWFHNTKNDAGTFNMTWVNADYVVSIELKEYTDEQIRSDMQ